MKRETVRGKEQLPLPLHRDRAHLRWFTIWELNHRLCSFTNQTKISPAWNEQLGLTNCRTNLHRRMEEMGQMLSEPQQQGCRGASQLQSLPYEVSPSLSPLLRLYAVVSTGQKEHNNASGWQRQVNHSQVSADGAAWTECSLHSLLQPEGW